MRILKIYSPRDFQIYNRVLLTIFTKLHITSDNWTYNFWPPSPISSLPLHHPPPPPLATTNVFPVSLSYVCVCVCLFFFNSTWNWDHMVFIFICLLISLSIMPSSSKSFHGFLNFCYMIINICSYFSFYTYIALLLTFLHLRH